MRQGRAEGQFWLYSEFSCVPSKLYPVQFHATQDRSCKVRPRLPCRDKTTSEALEMARIMMTGGVTGPRQCATLYLRHCTNRWKFSAHITASRGKKRSHLSCSVHQISWFGPEARREETSPPVYPV